MGKRGLAHNAATEFAENRRGSDCLRLLLFSFSYVNTSFITTSSHPQSMSLPTVSQQSGWLSGSFYLVNPEYLLIAFGLLLLMHLAKNLKIKKYLK